MQAHPTLTVIVPVYNGSDYISATISSILKNSVDFPLECIVVNDGSTDSTAHELKAFGSQICVIDQLNKGESAAVNRGITASHGDYLLVVSADDPILSPEIFMGVAEFFSENLDAVAWYPDWQIINSSGIVETKVILKDFKFEDLFDKNIVLPGPGTWIRKSAAVAIGGRNPKWRFVGDYDFWLRLSMLGKLVHRTGVLAQWRRHSKSTSISQRGPAMANERILVIREFVDNNRNNLKPRSINRAVATSYYLAARLGFFSYEVPAREFAIKAIVHDWHIISLKRIHEFVFFFLFPWSKRFFHCFEDLFR